MGLTFCYCIIWVKNPPIGFPIMKDIITVDGVRINIENGWELVRASNTTPVLVTRFNQLKKKMQSCMKMLLII